MEQQHIAIGAVSRKDTKVVMILARGTVIFPSGGTACQLKPSGSMLPEVAIMIPISPTPGVRMKSAQLI